jgi:hypothetical protein
MFPPAATGFGKPAFVTARSACGLRTSVVSVAELLPGSGSVVLEPMVAVLVIIPPTDVSGFTFTTRVKLRVAALARLGLMAVTVPVPPAASVVTVQPAGAVNDTRVALAGRTSVRVTSIAASGPSLVTVRV